MMQGIGQRSSLIEILLQHPVGAIAASPKELLEIQRMQLQLLLSLGILMSFTFLRIDISEPVSM